ncbi:MAG: lipoate--protein ligase [Alloprevotella sp.]
MHYIVYPFDDIRKLSFYLATEEFLARHTDLDECFFMWQVRPTVIFGRNQLIENEVNLDYCREHGIETYRRKSGGGCVYADMNNIMFSYVNHGENITFTFDRYINMVVDVLRELGVEAYTSGRNDILIDGKKVSGNAFYHLPHRNIVHGTMLFDTDWQNMVGSITPSSEKLVSKGVESVRQHVTVLKDHIDIDIETFKQFVRTHLCSEEYRLTPDEVTKIEAIEREYHDPAYIYGNNPRYTLHRRRRLEGCGEFEVYLELKNNIIKDLDFKGDFFLVGDLNALLSKFKNCPCTPEALRQALAGIALDQYIMNLQPDALISLLMGE